MKNRTSNLLEKFAGSQLEKDMTVRGGATDIASHKQETTYVCEGNDIRHTCDTTTSDVVVVGYSYPDLD